MRSNKLLYEGYSRLMEQTELIRLELDLFISTYQWFCNLYSIRTHITWSPINTSSCSFPKNITIKLLYHYQPMFILVRGKTSEYQIIDHLFILYITISLGISLLCYKSLSTYKSFCKGIGRLKTLFLISYSCQYLDYTGNIPVMAIYSLLTLIILVTPTSSEVTIFDHL